MCTAHGGELPPKQAEALRRALRLEWLSLAYFVSALTFTGLVMGQSQAMKTAWIDDVLAVVPPLAVLVTARVRRSEPCRAYPYGRHRAVTIAFLCAAVALLGLGLVLVVEGVAALARGERPTIGAVTLLGRDVWLGWLMLAALTWSAVPSVFLGRRKLELAREIHDKAVYADAEMNRADWLAGGAAMLGIVGVGAGLWWADAVAGTAIAVDIGVDGFKNLRAAVADLMDRRPRQVDDADEDPLPDRLARAVRALPWVAQARVRMREHGHVYFGEVFVVPLDEREPFARVREVHAIGASLDWRVHDLTVQLCDAAVCVREPGGDGRADSQ